MRPVLLLFACAIVFASPVAAQVPASEGQPTLKPATAPTPDKSSRPGTTRGRTRPAPKKADLPQQWPEPVAGSEIPDAEKQTEAKAHELFEKAKNLLSQGEPNEALSLFRDVEKLEPNRFETQTYIGITLSALKKKDEAVSAFQNSVRINPKSAPAHFNLCRGLAINNEGIEAIEECREAVRLATENTKFRAYLADLYLSYDRSAEAIQLLRGVGARSQNNIYYLGTLGDAYFMAGEYALAADIYEKLAFQWPKVSLAYLRLSDVYDYLDRPIDSITAAKKFAEADPKFVYAQLNLGRKYQSAGFIDEAITAYTQTISLDKNCGEAYLGLTSMYEIIGNEEAVLDSIKNAYRLMPRTVPLAIKYGELQSDAGNHAEAIDALEWANSARPNIPDIMRALAFAYLDAHRDEDGIALMERANEISPLPPGFKINFVDLKVKQDLLSRFEELQAAVKKNPNDIRSRVGLSSIYRYKDMFPEAEEQFLAILKLIPTYETNNAVAIFYIDNRQYEKALPLIRKAIELKSNHVFYMTLSSTLAKLGRLDEAITAAENAVDIKPDSLELHLHLGELLLKKGDRSKALNEYQAAFALRSGDPRPNFKLAWLYVRMGNKEGAFRHYSILKGIVPNQLEYLEACLHGRFGELP